MPPQPQDVAALILAKASLKFQGNKEIEAMKEVAKAHEKRSLGDFEGALKTWKEGQWRVDLVASLLDADYWRCCLPLIELSNDPIIRSHLASLYDTLLSQNLVRVIEPYSRVEIAYIAEQVGQPVQSVETKCVGRLALCGQNPSGGFADIFSI